MPQSQKEYERIKQKHGHKFLAGKQVELCFNCIHWKPTMDMGCELRRCPVSLTEEWCADRGVK